MKQLNNLMFNFIKNGYSGSMNDDYLNIHPNQDEEIINVNPILKSAIYGQAIGDALGVPVEFKERDTFYVEDMLGFGSHLQPVGTWSDDTSMSLATCYSIKTQKKY